MFIDTHCHLADEGQGERAITEFFSGGGKMLITIGYNAQNSHLSKTLAENHENVYFTAGIHPSETKDFNENALGEIEKLLSHEKCVALGEIGLDYHYEGYDKKAQQDIFLKQVYLASKFNMPVSIHLRDAYGDMQNLIIKCKNYLKGGVLHCYSGSREMLPFYLDLGFYISFAGPITFKNASKGVEAVKYVPLDRILTETDSPYLTPVPFRGQVNSPKNVKFVAEKIAEIKGVLVEEVYKNVEINTKKLFYKI